jgi:hypothetical protein
MQHYCHECAHIHSLFQGVGRCAANNDAAPCNRRAVACDEFEERKDTE